MALSSLSRGRSHPKWIEWSSKSPQCDHFIHCSTKDENAIAYTKNEEAGSMDIRTRISPSKYFEKFVSAEYRDLYVPEWLLAWTKYISAVELKFASTREEIRHVYEIGPDSCMSGPSSKFFHRKEGPHPAEAYAAGDLAIAYTIRKNGKINSRALVWPEKKVGGRRYGSEANLLGDLLKAEGYYQQAPSFENARLLLIDAVPYTKKPMTFVCPYIDSPSQYVSCHEEEKVLRLHDRKAEGRVSGNTQAGYLAFPLPFLSDFSGKIFCSASDPPVTVFVSQRKTEIWATSEASEHAYTCCLKNRLYSKKKCPPTLVMVGDFITCVCPYALDKLTIIKCDFYGCNVFRKDTENVVTGYEPDGSFIRERWSYPAIRAFTFCYGEHKFALWLKSNLPWVPVWPAHDEHRHPTSRHYEIWSRHLSMSRHQGKCRQISSSRRFPSERRSYVGRDRIRGRRKNRNRSCGRAARVITLKNGPKGGVYHD